MSYEWRRWLEALAAWGREVQDASVVAGRGGGDVLPLLAGPMDWPASLGGGLSAAGHAGHQCDRLVPPGGRLGYHPGTAAARTSGLVLAGRHGLLRRVHDVLHLRVGDVQAGPRR